MRRAKPPQQDTGFSWGEAAWRAGTVLTAALTSHLTDAVHLLWSRGLLSGAVGVWRGPRSWGRTARGPHHLSPHRLTSCVTMSSELNLSEPQLPHLQQSEGVGITQPALPRAASFSQHSPHRRYHWASEPGKALAAPKRPVTRVCEACGPTIRWGRWQRVAPESAYLGVPGETKVLEVLSDLAKGTQPARGV